MKTERWNKKGGEPRKLFLFIEIVCVYDKIYIDFATIIIKVRV